MRCGTCVLIRFVGGLSRCAITRRNIGANWQGHDCTCDAKRRARLLEQLGEADGVPREQRDWFVQVMVEEHQCPPLKIVPECPFRDPFAARPSDCRICWLEACEKAAQAFLTSSPADANVE